MATKVFEDGNYIVISGSPLSPDVDLNDAKDNVTCHPMADGRFLMYSNKIGRHILEVGDQLIDGLDVPYTIETFTTFYRANTVFPDASQVGAALSGVADYADTGTATTPITILADTFTFITNNGLGVNTDLANLPDGVTVIWDTVANQFDFSELSIGTVVDFRFDLNIIAPANNTDVELAIDFAIGGAVSFTQTVARKFYKKAGTYLNEIFLAKVYIKNSNMMDFPAKPKIKIDGITTLVSNGWLVSISNLKR